MGMGCLQAEQAVRRLLAAAINNKRYCKMFSVLFMHEGNAVRIADLVQESLL